ncbi:MAG: hypothetical protein AAGD07_01595 [Planctomycetota bacterium]
MESPDSLLFMSYLPQLASLLPMTLAFWRGCPLHRSCLIVLAWLWFASNASCLAQQPGIWVNSGEDKVTREDTRLLDGKEVVNSVWNGETITLSGSRNEVVSFCVIIEAGTSPIKDVQASFRLLDGRAGAQGEQITTRVASRNDFYDFRGRNIELFFIRYLPIRGCSRLAYGHYDERLVPERLQRPHDRNGDASGGWLDRPDHDQHYPDIAVPLELHPKFVVAAGQSQSVWCDITLPRDAEAGLYEGTYRLSWSDGSQDIPVRLRVHPLTLPDLPSAKTMLYISEENINSRFLGQANLDGGPASSIVASEEIIDRYFQLAHRHRVSLITDHVDIGQVQATWDKRLHGDLFTPEAGYEGPGEGIGNNVFALGTYGIWPWKGGGKEAMWANTDQWVNFFDSSNYRTPTSYFLYLIDESEDFETIEKWCRWVKSNPGPGKRMPTLATLPLIDAYEHTPLLSIPASTTGYGITRFWKRAADHYRRAPRQGFYLYNGFRPGSGTLVIEDDGVAMRQLGWTQFKTGAARWFVWEGTYYKNLAGGSIPTKLFSTAHTFGPPEGRDPSLGETGYNYNNGDGVLFYPGTDLKHGDESYGVPAPFASLRLKHWRRGLQDYEYLKMAARANLRSTAVLIQAMIPRVMWEVPVAVEYDPTWARTGISWSNDPDDWNAAVEELSRIILSAREGNASSGASR